MLRNRIHQTMKDLACNDVILLRLHLKLSSVLTRIHWNLMDSLTNSAFEAVRKRVRARLEVK